MRKNLFFVLAFLMLSMNAFTVSASFSKPETKSEVVETKPAPTGLQDLTAEQLLSLTTKGYQELTGKKMSFKDKFVLKYVQQNIKRDLRKTGEVDIKSYFDDGSMRFNIGGFALGFFLGLIGVALAHIFSNNKSFRRSSWYGVGAVLILAIIIAAASGGQ